MKTRFASTFDRYASRVIPSRRVRCLLMAGGVVIPIASVGAIQPGLAAPADETTVLAQALPTPLPPLPTSGSPTTVGEQYLVLVNGSSDLLLQQVRQIEPDAFVNYVDGRSVIQAGRFTSFQNAQIRADQLVSFGVGAQVQPANSVGAPIAVTPPTDYSLAFPAAGQVPTAVPASTVAAAPSSIEFGQAAPFQTAVPPSPTAPPPLTSPPPVSSPTVINQPIPSGYYVVIPARTVELGNIANQVINLGAPASLVHTRTAPRGPHVAVGPYEDHGIAYEWNGYLRDSGLGAARVHFE